MTERLPENVAPIHPAVEDDPNRATDRANGEELAHSHQDRLLWTPEAGWLVYDGRRWVPDDAKRRVLMIGALADRMRVQGELQNDDVWRQRARRLESVQGLTGALAFGEPLLARSVTDFDKNPLLLNCPNGVLDLRTGQLTPHSPQLMLSRLCPTVYDPEARDKTWEKVVWEALEGDEHRLRVTARFAGYTLTGLTTEKKFLVPHGPANTGKSTVTEPLYRTLGDVGEGGYGTVWDAEVVQADLRINRAEKLFKARGARLILVGELVKGARMADNFVKQLTGGDTMDARALYKASFSYRPQAKLWMATNYVPASADPALQTRLLIVPFRHVPPKTDPGIKRHLDHDEGAHRAILAWATRACGEWLRRGTLGQTPWLTAVVKEYALASDHVMDFIDQALERVAGYEDSSTPDEVWAMYNIGWAPENVQRPLKRRVLERALEEHGMARKKGTHSAGPTRWVGFRVRRREEN